MTAARTLRGGLVAAVGLMATGCVSVLPEAPPPPMIYPLAYQPDASAALASPHALAVAPNGEAVIAVAAPVGPRALLGAEMVWRREGVLAFVEAVEWSGRTPDLLQAMVVDAIDLQGLARAGVRSGGGVRADYEIQWDLASFEVREENGALAAHIAGAARIVDTRTRSLIAAERFDVVRPLADRSTRSAAAALQGAARDAADQIARSLTEAAMAQANAASINR